MGQPGPARIACPGEPTLPVAFLHTYMLLKQYMQYIRNIHEYWANMHLRVSLRVAEYVIAQCLPALTETAWCCTDKVDSKVAAVSAVCKNAPP